MDPTSPLHTSRVAPFSLYYVKVLILDTAYTLPLVLLLLATSIEAATFLEAVRGDCHLFLVPGLKYRTSTTLERAFAIYEG